MGDTRRALTPLGLMVLALLAEGDMHPYEMIRLMRIRRDDRLVTITNGTMYHTVARLQKAGLLAEVGVDRDGNRPERTTYTVTDAGTAAVSEWIRRELPRVDSPEAFRLALAEAHNLDRGEVLGLLRQRRDALQAQHREYVDSLAGANAKGVPAQYLIELEREEALQRCDLAWLDAFIPRLAGDDFAWGDHAVTDRYLAQREAARR
ncbi:PadR family transcriptional regulator [Microbacterium sp. C7(2022)]|uniref:PadR family transcriptional regulator n=1 Tax=Microbacterium sp. C7(2022) TaxID=2992759 RepID=UPI00237BC17C|nr:PadR family transcriptional regulator [Microbacterium sp. C7(2022)]MDE0545095.1 PadR family transcriptional regulator [Microbacterium sp. C7(2022)]